MDGVLSLIQDTRTKNSKGAWVHTQTPREVFCQVESVTRTEFYAGGRAGLNPEYKFTVFHGDYQGEQELTYGGHDYAIYRTFVEPGSDYIELYAERKGGTNAAPETPEPDPPEPEETDPEEDQEGSGG